MPGVANKGENIVAPSNENQYAPERVALYARDMLNYANSTNAYKIWADIGARLIAVLCLSMQISSIASMWEDAIVIRIRMLTMRFGPVTGANIHNE